MVTVVKQIGNTKITVHSPSGIIAKSPEERRKWFRDEWAAGNPVVQSIVDSALNMQANARAKQSV